MVNLCKARGIVGFRSVIFQSVVKLLEVKGECVLRGVRLDDFGS